MPPCIQVSSFPSMSAFFHCKFPLSCLAIVCHFTATAIMIPFDRQSTLDLILHPLHPHSQPLPVLPKQMTLCWCIKFYGRIQHWQQKQATGSTFHESRYFGPPNHIGKQNLTKEPWLTDWWHRCFLNNDFSTEK